MRLGHKYLQIQNFETILPLKKKKKGSPKEGYFWSESHVF